MHNKNLILACLATAICAVSGQGLSNNDVPPECRSICQPVIDTERRCDNQFDDDGDDNVGRPGIPSDQQYRDCVCQDQSASQALAQCNECTVRYPNFYIDNDNDNDDGPGPDVDDNEVAQWARICGLPVQNNNGTNGTTTTGTLTATPSRLPTSLTTSLRTVTQTFDCDSPPDNDIDDILDDANDRPDSNENDPQCTRTTVVPVVGVATGRAGPITSVATSTPSGVSVSYVTSTGTDSAGNAATFTSAVASFTGAAALPTAAAGYFGAGAAALIAAFAL